MKQWKFLSLALLIAAGVSFTSCKDDDDDVMDLGPSINLKTGEGYTHEDFEVTEGNSVKFGINAAKSVTHDNNLTRFNVIYTTTNQTLTVIDSTFNSATFSADYNIQFFGVGSGKLTFRVTAQGGMTAEKELNVVVNEAGVSVKKNTDVELGSVNEPGIGSFYSTIEEQVYSIGEAAQNQQKIDFLFFRGATNLNTIAAPDNETAITVFNIGGWETKNATRFNRTEMTPEEFDAIQSPYLFPEFNNENAISMVNMLEIGDVIMFRTVAGKHGYIKIVDIYRGDKIKIDVIVEE